MNQPVYRSLLVVDVEDSTRWSNPGLEAMRGTLYRLLNEALPSSGEVLAKEDRGDGVMLVLDLPVLDVLDHVVEKLLTGVRNHNTTVDPQDWLRVRIAVNEGYVQADSYGWTSDALTATFRSNNAAMVKTALGNAPRAHGVVVVSDTVYQSVVRHGYRPNVAPAGYRITEIDTSDGLLRVWVRVPGYAEPPLPVADAVQAVNEGRQRGNRENRSIEAGNFFAGDVRAGTIVGRDNYGSPA